MPMTHPIKILLVCPTLNPGEDFDRWLSAVKMQSLVLQDILIIDSSSSDETALKARNSGCDVCVIQRTDFNHGASRNLAIPYFELVDYVVYLTQDAYLSDKDSLLNMIKPFEDERVAAVYGRQLPRPSAVPIEAHARVYNYPELPCIRSYDDINELGLRTAFLSNSFAAYRVSALLSVGGFPDRVIFGEDMYVAAKLIIGGWKIAYAADACVYHSHSYSLRQEFSRYFDMGVFHLCEPWIRRELGAAEGEGVKFVLSEQKYLMERAFWLMPEAIFRVFIRYLGYRLGLINSIFPVRLNKFLAMNKEYFSNMM